MSSFTVVDAFCGAGGLSLGLSKAGCEMLLGFDNDPVCIETIRANSTHIVHPVLQLDIQEMLNGRLKDEIGLEPGQLDLLAGGPPCQGFSVQRTIGGDDDDRNNRVHDYMDLIAENVPRLFLMENVVGLCGKRGKPLLDHFISRAESLGYIVQQGVLDAQQYGVPQRRRRLFVVGQHRDWASSPFEWPKPSSRPAPTVRDTIAHLPSPPTDGTEHPAIRGHRADRLSPKNRARIEALLPGQGRSDLPSHLLADCHSVDAEIIGHRGVYGRMAWDQVAPTITARFDSFTRGKFGHPSQIRTISLYEGQLLQTFPCDYWFMGSKVQIARQIGNAVPPKLATTIAYELLRTKSAHREA